VNPRSLTGMALGLLLAGGLAAPARAQNGVGASPAFKPEIFFAGRTRSEGVMRGSDGAVSGRLSGETRGRRERDGSTSFDQTIRFEDGTTRRRSWRLVRNGAQIEATATDVVGVARGEIAGRELRLLSTVRTDPNNPLLDVDFDQRMVLQPDGRSVTVRSVVTKLGIKLREIDETFVASRPSRAAGAK
jgi:hypothetical protein